MSDDLLKRLTYFAFKLEGKGQLESAASDAMAEAAERLSAHSTAIDGLRAEIERLHRAHQTACEGGDLLRAALLSKIERLRASLKQFRCSCDPGECVEYGERWASVCEKGEARDVLERKP